ncbi:penicillin-binding protein activator [candidate division KSB1 bacterium]|nr:penicillin-binding protein activator [candidate division KSB1 bacterium]
MRRIELKNRRFAWQIRSLLFLSLALCLAILERNAHAQETDAKNLFNQALILYRNQQYEQAKVKLLLLTAQGRENPTLTAGLLLLARTYEELDQPVNSQSYALALVSQFPESRYQADARLILARLAERNGDPAAALDHILHLLRTSQSEKLSDRGIDLANRILASGVSPEQIEKLAETHSLALARELIHLWRARAAYGQGDKVAGDRLIDELLAKKPSTTIQKAALQMKSLSPEQLSYPIRVGMILPLSGVFSHEANDFLRGAAFALKQRNEKVPEIELIVKDSKGLAVQAVQSMLELEREKVALVVGELEGTLSAAIAGVAARANLPLVVPIATDNGIAGLSPSIYQLNCDLETRGSELARYAIDSLKLRRFATLAPADEYGSALTDAFCTAVDRLGGRIVVQQWYYSGTEDLQRQFKAIRMAGFYESFRDSLENQNRPVTLQAIENLFMSQDSRVRSETTDKTGLLDTRDIPVTSIDGIFLPVYAEDLAYIAPQMALHNIQARPLGGNFWADEELLQLQRSYINGAVFVTGFYLAEYDPQYIAFQNDFRRTTSASPGESALYGYNVMKLLIETIDAGRRQREELLKNLDSLTSLPVLGGEIVFQGGRRVNRALNLLEFRDGNIRRLIP